MTLYEILQVNSLILDIPYKQELYASYPDRIKQAEFCVLVLFFQATRKGASIDEFKNYLLAKQDFKSALVDELVITYKLHKEDFKQKALNFAPCSLPYINDVSWSLLCNVGSSLITRSGEITYKIQLEGKNHNSVDGQKEVLAEFICRPEELQALINRLKEIERSCRRVVANKI